MQAQYEKISYIVKTHMDLQKSGHASVLDLGEMEAGVQLLDLVGSAYARKFISYNGLYGEDSRCGRCGNPSGTFAGDHCTDVGTYISCHDKDCSCPLCQLFGMDAKKHLGCTYGHGFLGHRGHSPPTHTGTLYLPESISSISFGSPGGNAMDMHIITNLGELHYIRCGKGVIASRRYLKQEFTKLGFNKTHSGDRAVYFNNLVTFGPSKPQLLAKIIEHAKRKKKKRKTSKQRAASKAKKQLTAMGIIVGGMRSDSSPHEEGEEEASSPGDEPIIEEEKIGKLITIYKWRLAQLNMADAKKGGGTKWEGLAQFMDEHKLHGIALQELRLKDQTTFTAQKEKYKGLSLLIHPCIEGDKGGEAGGTCFLVRTELLEQELFLDFGSISTVGFYGPEVISTLKIRTANHFCTWVSMYVRQRPGIYDKGYEFRKYEPLKHIRNKTVMGDLNGSVVYAQSVQTWVRNGLGGEDSNIRNKMQKYGAYLSDMWKTQGMEDISAKGGFAWRPTRTHVNGTANKLDCVIVSSRIKSDLRAKVTSIKPITMYRSDLTADFSESDSPQNYTISDHDAVIIEMKSNCRLRVHKFVSTESYKLAPFLNSQKKQLQYTKETNKLGSELMTLLGTGLDNINSRTVEGLKEVSIRRKLELVVTSDQLTLEYTRMLKQ
jgi:hypothetical protein